MRRKVFVFGGAVLAVILVLSGVSGAFLYSNAREDQLRKADAVIVLGGEHDGREDYGLSLVRDGAAPVLVLSDPYPPTDRIMRRVCQEAVANVEILCRKPELLTTRGEAILTRQLAQERGWKSVIVVSWRYHLPRARRIFEQCFSPDPGALVMRAVPRDYDFSVAEWQFTYLYQNISTVKNALQPECAGEQ
ncbi:MULTISPECIES: YdcF family protein [Mycolicibacterium]|uniref:DUF218 domain-containing protein n=1 Tax=Mycolicibacterium wolinskyi TaxID=59750 RepID=A0A132PVJ8_9MYCO|nr:MULTISPECIES: YdcF family protein [Mycolicibacterium]KWX26187.1 hypothetical protein AFM11_02880 [Mycolicibacterium wolinskyi]MCV7288781.1 YdcF family protein [Mycolicibacterium wolinskyi]MCV7296003.1 YdcF family protein [Mycolicibacterium goodii]ORX11969.1 hypothetical protein AWC31_35660 [Mycolicibacterium wolinskyi]